MSEATITKRQRRKNQRAEKKVAENENPTPTRRQKRKSERTRKKIAANERSIPKGRRSRQIRRQKRKTVQENAGGGKVELFQDQIVRKFGGGKIKK